MQVKLKHMFSFRHNKFVLDLNDWALFLHGNCKLSIPRSVWILTQHLIAGVKLFPLRNNRQMSRRKVWSKHKTPSAGVEDNSGKCCGLVLGRHDLTPVTASPGSWHSWCPHPSLLGVLTPPRLFPVPCRGSQPVHSQLLQKLRSKGN